MDNETLKKMTIQTFEQIAPVYDCEALKFFATSARASVQLLGPKESDLVLDVACGTGAVTLPLAQKLPKGKVTALDFSPAMLACAKQKAHTAGLRNITFIEADMQAMPFADNTFDAAVSAFGVFFVSDVLAQVRAIAAKVKPGGKVLVTTFEDGSLAPLREKMLERLKAYDITQPNSASEQVNSKEKCARLFEQAGLADVRVEAQGHGYFLRDADQWWEVVQNAGLRGLVNKVPDAEKESFKKAHLADISALAGPGGIRLNVNVLFTSGTKRAY